MGAYFKGVCLKTNKITVDKFVTSWDYDNGAKIQEHAYVTNDFVSAFESMLFQKPHNVVWASDDDRPCKARKTNVYDRCIDEKLAKPFISVREIHRNIIINHSKKVYISKVKLKPTRYGSFVHPLPLLTTENRAVIEIYGKHDKNIGTWARDLIEIHYLAPKDYKEIQFNLNEMF